MQLAGSSRISRRLPAVRSGRVAWVILIESITAPIVLTYGSWMLFCQRAIDIGTRLPLFPSALIFSVAILNVLAEMGEGFPGSFDRWDQYPWDRLSKSCSV